MLRARHDNIGLDFHRCVARDFDGDGWVDFVFGSGVSGTWYVVWNQGGWELDQQVLAEHIAPPGGPFSGYSMGLGAGDWDRDGRLDLVMLESWVSSSLRFFFGEGDRSFGRERRIELERTAWALEVADLNGDGMEDLLVAEQAVWPQTETTTLPRLLLYLGNGEGGFTLSAVRRIAEPDPYLWTGDVDGDGDLDVFLTGGAGLPYHADGNGNGRAGVELFLNPGDGTLGRRLVLPFESAPSAVVVHDFNRDGLSDLAVTLRGSVLLAVAFNEAVAPELPRAGPAPAPRACGARFVRGDVMTVMTPGWSTGVYNVRRLLLYLFTPEGPPPCLDAADLNDDGRLDLTDAVHLVRFVFLGGPAPPPPYPDCADDPTADTLGCEEFLGCPE